MSVLQFSQWCPMLLCRFRTILLAGLALAVCSCGSGEIKREKCFPVTGRVLYKGKPAIGALVIFHRDEKIDGKAISASATTDDLGNYSLSTYDADDGAPAGSYRVAITMKGDAFVRKNPFKKTEERDQMLDRYRDPKTSGIKAQVYESPTEVPPFNLK